MMNRGVNIVVGMFIMWQFIVLNQFRFGNIFLMFYIIVFSCLVMLNIFRFCCLVDSLCVMFLIILLCGLLMVQIGWLKLMIIFLCLMCVLMLVFVLLGELQCFCILKVILLVLLCLGLCSVLMLLVMQLYMLLLVLVMMWQVNVDVLNLCFVYRISEVCIVLIYEFCGFLLCSRCRKWLLMELLLVFMLMVWLLWFQWYQYSSIEFRQVISLLVMLCVFGWLWLFFFGDMQLSIDMLVCIMFIGCVDGGSFFSVVLIVVGMLCSDFSLVLQVISLVCVGSLLCISRWVIFLNLLVLVRFRMLQLWQCRLLLLWLMVYSVVLLVVVFDRVMDFFGLKLGVVVVLFMIFLGKQCFGFIFWW